MKKHLYLLLLISGLAVVIFGFPTASFGDGSTVPESVISRTGLLPIYGVDFRFEQSWLGGETYPSTTEHDSFGVNETFRNAWDTIRPAGFNCIRVPIDTANAKTSAAQAANLCVWAANNNLRVVLSLDGSTADTSAFVKELAEMMTSDEASMQAYSGILAFQLDGSPDATRQLVLGASSLRAEEQEALAASGLAPSPIMVSVSFDYELARAGSMAGSALGDETYQKAVGSLRLSAAALADSPDVDIVNVEWFPGSIGAGTVDRLPSVLEDMSSDLSGKQMILTTGFSTAFGPPWAQSQFYTAAFTNLADFRARNATTVPFLGVIFRRALDTADSDPEPPTPEIPTQITEWDLSAKSQQLAPAMAGKISSPDVEWWLEMSERHMALLAPSVQEGEESSFVAQPGLNSLIQVASAVEEVDESFSMEDYATEPGIDYAMETDPGYGAEGYTLEGESIASALKSKVKEGLMGLLDRVFQKIGDKILNSGSDLGGSWPSDDTMVLGWDDPAGYPVEPTEYTWESGSVAVDSVSFLPAGPRVGDQVTTQVTLRNESTVSDITDLVVAALDSDGMLLDTRAQQNGVGIGAGGTQVVELLWTPIQPGHTPVRVEVMDPMLAVLSSSEAAVSVSALPGDSALPAAAIECPQSGISVVPSSPVAGVPAQIRVTLRNTGLSSASGLDILLLDLSADPLGSLIAEADNNTVPPGGERVVEINWVPPEARNYQLGIQVWQGFTEMLASASMNPVSVSASPGVTETASVSLEQIKFSPAAPKVGQNVIVSVDVRNEGSSALSGLDLFLLSPMDSAAALAYDSVASLAAGSLKNVNLFWTPESPGSREIEIQLWDAQGFVASNSTGVSVAPGTSGGMPIPKLPTEVAQGIRTVIPPGLPHIHDLGFGQVVTISGEMSPPSLTLVNPYSVPIRNLSVTFLADGKEVETRSLGTVLPGQSRKLKFSKSPPLREGKHALEIALAGSPMGRGGDGDAGRMLRGSVKTEITVSPRMIATAGALGSGGVSGLRASPPLSPMKTTSTKPGTLPVRSTLPPAFTIGGTRVASQLASPPAPFSQPTPSVSVHAVKPVTSTGMSRPDATTAPPPAPAPILGVKPVPREIPGVSRPTPTATDPAAPPVIPGVTPKSIPERPGTAIPPPSATSPVTPPTIPPVAPIPTETSGTQPVVKVPPVTSPVVRPQPVPTETAPVEKPDATIATRPTTTIMTPSVSSTVQPRITVKPNLSVVSTDILYTPKPPEPGKPMAFDITVRNRANAAVSGVTVGCILKSDGNPAARKSFTIQVPANGSAPVKWELPAPAGKQLVLEVTVAHSDDSDLSDNKASLTVPMVVRPVSDLVAPTTTTTVQPRMVNKPNLSIASADIIYNPRPPQPGKSMTFDITVRNKANAAASGVGVNCVFKADGNLAARKSFTVQVAANGSTPVKWELPAPAGKQLTLEVIVTHNDDSDVSDNKASITIPMITR